MKKSRFRFLKKLSAACIVIALAVQFIPAFNVFAATTENKDIPAVIDTTACCSAIDCSSSDQWIPMYPAGQPESGTWAQWDSEHYADISERGYQDIGSLHLKSKEGKNTGVAIKAGMTSGQQYTLGMYVKGTTNNPNRVLALYGNGDGAIIGKPEHSASGKVGSENLSTEWSYVEYSFTAQLSQLNLIACDWGDSDLYIDNITLKNRYGRDILSGKGDFWVNTDVEPVYEPMSINPLKLSSAYDCRYTDCWVPMVPSGIPDNNTTWPEWGDTHMATIVPEGHDDLGALCLTSEVGKNTAVCFQAGMTAGSTYTLGMWVKGSTNNPNKVLALYGNGDNVIVGSPQYSPGGVVGSEIITPDWSYVEITFTALGSQFNLMTPDWGVSEVYIDNVTLRDQNGVDLLNGCGNFYRTVSTAVSDANLDFEMTATGVPLNWTHKGVLADSTAELYSENVYSGSRALRVLRQNGQLDCSFMFSQSMIPVAYGDKLELVAHIASRNSISGRFSMYFVGYDEIGNPYTDTCYGQERITNAGETWSQWDTYELLYTVPENVKYIQICLRVDGAQADVLIDDLKFYNYLDNIYTVYQEDFADPSVTTGLPGGWIGGGATAQNGYLTVSGSAETKLYMLRTGYTYSLDIQTGGVSSNTGKASLEAVNWDGTSAGQPVNLRVAGNKSYHQSFTAISGVFYRLVVEGNGIVMDDISLRQTAEKEKNNTQLQKPENLPATAAPTTTSSVEIVGGKTYMLVNDEPVIPMWYARPENPDLYEAHTVTEFAKAGVDTVVSYVFLNNLYGDVWTKEGFVPDAVDDMMLSTLAGNTDAKLIVALDFNAPQWWCEENPGELAALSSSEVARTNASFASEKWKKESGEIMLQVVDYLMSRSYANQIVGFKVTGGYTLEWNWWALSGNTDDVGDFSQCGIALFRQWLTEKYGTNAALQKAYGNNSITLQNAMPPSIQQRSDDYLDSVITVQDHPEMMDYELYMAELKADTIEYFAALIKDAIGHRLIVGTYGGYFYMGGGYEFSSAVSNVYFQRLLQSENIDFIKSPWRYGQREIGDSGEFMGPVDSLDLYGKLWIVEEDTRLNLQDMHGKQDDNASVGWTRDYQQSVEQLKRNFSYVLSKGMGVSFYNLNWNFTDDAQYYGAIRQMAEEMEKSLCMVSQSTADIAVFVDGQSQMLIPFENESANSILHLSIYQQQLNELGHTGTTYDMYLLDDLVAGLVPEHKINIFLATTMMTPEERTAIENQLKKNGNILVWLFTDGISDGASTDLSLMEEVIGMDLSLVSTERQHTATAKITNNTHWLTNGMDTGRYYGVIHYDKLSPVIAVNDSSAVSLAKHTGYPLKTALAVKDVGSWTSVYSALPNLPQDFFRNMLRQVNGHIYTDSPSDVIYANTDYVAIHSLFAGERIIYLPEKATVYDTFSGNIFARDTDSFNVTFTGKETKLFRLMESNVVLTELDDSQKTGAYIAPSNAWTPMYPSGTPGGTWPQWDSNHYGRIIAEGYGDPGALNLKSYYYQNAGIALDVGMTPGQSYTMGLWAKGTSDANRVLALYGNGDPAIIPAYTDLSENWKYYEITFTAALSQVNLMVADWGNSDIYIDNITLRDANGNDLLDGFGDFSREMDNSAHNWLEATCTQPKTCFVCKLTAGDAVGHSYGQWVTVKEATLQNDGLQEKVCSVCRDKITESIPCLAGNVDSWGLTLGSDLTVKFAVSIHPDLVQTAAVEITVAEEKVTYPVKNAAKDAQSGCYLFHVSVAAAQMTDEFQVRIVNGEDVSVSNIYTVLQYAQSVLADSSMSQYHSLLRQMLNYGGVAQNYFNYHTDRLANDKLTGVEETVVPESWNTSVVTDGETDGVSFYGASLAFREKTVLRFYFSVTDFDETHIFQWNDTTLEPIAKGEYVYVELPGINPQDLDQLFTVSVNGELSVTYSPIHYIVRMNRKGSTEIQPLMLAMYNYYLAAEQFCSEL